MFAANGDAMAVNATGVEITRQGARLHSLKTRPIYQR